MYQEDYPSLLMATEIGERITYSPSSYTSLLPKFEQYALSAVDEVNMTPWVHQYNHVISIYTADSPEQSQQHCKGATCGSNFCNLTSKTFIHEHQKMLLVMCIIYVHCMIQSKIGQSLGGHSRRRTEGEGGVARA